MPNEDQDNGHPEGAATPVPPEHRRRRLAIPVIAAAVALVIGAAGGASAVKMMRPMFPSHLVGEAVAEVQTCRMGAFAPGAVGFGDAAGGGGGDGHDFEAEAVDQLFHFIADVATGRDDQGFGDRAGGDQEIVFGFEGGNQGIGLWFAKHDRHQGGCVDGDHSGRPSSA